jgi:hypothetical protein
MATGSHPFYFFFLSHCFYIRPTPLKQALFLQWWCLDLMKWMIIKSFKVWHSSQPAALPTVSCGCGMWGTKLSSTHHKHGLLWYVRCMRSTLWHQECCDTKMPGPLRMIVQAHKAGPFSVASQGGPQDCYQLIFGASSSLLYISPNLTKSSLPALTSQTWQFKRCKTPCGKWYLGKIWLGEINWFN